MRSCIAKLIDLQNELTRQAKRDGKPKLTETDLPQLWILTPTLSAEKLTEETELIMNSSPLYLEQIDIATQKGRNEEGKLLMIRMLTRKLGKSMLTRSISSIVYP